MVDASPGPPSVNKAASRRWSGLSFRRHRFVSQLSKQPCSGFFSRRSLLLWALLSSLFLFLLAGPARPGGYIHTEQQNQPLLQAADLSRQLRELSLGQSDHSLLDPAFRLAVRQSSAATPDSAQWQSNSSLQLLADRIATILTAFSNAKPTVSCTWDSSLPVSNLAAQGKVLLAANMRNNEDLLPHFSIQLLQLLAAIPHGNAFVSIYESGSTDDTGSWLEVLKDLLVCMGIPHRIIIGGSLTRLPDQDRIDFLAQARNRALEPLWLSKAFSAKLLEMHDGSSARRLHSWNVHLPQGASAADSPMWEAKKVVFLNDVYFCAQDVVRLLQHDGDMACGMDFDRPTIESLTHQEQHRLFGVYLWEKWRVPRPIGRWLGKSGLVTRHWRLSPATNAAYQATIPMGFYDTWVARDTDGKLFLKNAPYVTDPYSLERVAQGLPFPVKCCWNGLVVMDAKPFSQHHLRVRMHKQGECAASECSLVCNDLQRLGFRKFIVDPSVRQAYNVPDAQLLYNKASVLQLPLRRWSFVQNAPAIDWSLVPHRPYVQCCGLPEGHNMIEFDKDCFWENFMTPNYTAMA